MEVTFHQVTGIKRKQLPESGNPARKAYKYTIIEESGKEHEVWFFAASNHLDIPEIEVVE